LSPLTPADALGALNDVSVCGRRERNGSKCQKKRAVLRKKESAGSSGSVAR